MIPRDTKPFRITRRMMIVAIVCAVLSLAVYGLVVYAIRTSSKHVAVLETQVRVLEGEEREVGTLKKELSSMEERQDKLAQYFIDVNDIVPFLETVEGYGRATSVATKFDAFNINKNPNRLDVVLVADGSFADMYRFFSYLENTPYAVTINDVQLQLSVPIGLEAQGGAPQTTTWNARVKLSVASLTGVK